MTDKLNPEQEKAAKAHPAKTEFAQPVQDIIMEVFQGKVIPENGSKK